MKINTSLNKSGKQDYVVLDEDFFSQGRLHGIANQGGTIQVGHFVIQFTPEGNDLLKLELRYVPKGNYHKPEAFIRKKKKKVPLKSEMEEEVIDI